MAVDKLVDSTQLDSDLTSVANAIRTKGGTSASLAFPSGFVSAINAISGGGGSSYTLLNSGSYTLASDSSTMSIPVAYSGTAKSLYVVAENGATNAGTWAWCHIFDTSDLTGTEFQSVWNVKYGANGSQLASNNSPSLSSSAIGVARYNTSNIIKAQKYLWYIYGEAAS